MINSAREIRSVFANNVVTPNCDSKNFFRNQQYVASVRYNFWENILKMAVKLHYVDLLYDCWYGNLLNLCISLQVRSFGLFHITL